MRVIEAHSQILGRSRVGGGSDRPETFGIGRLHEAASRRVACSAKNGRHRTSPAAVRIWTGSLALSQRPLPCACA